MLTRSCSVAVCKRVEYQPHRRTSYQKLNGGLCGAGERAVPRTARATIQPALNLCPTVVNSEAELWPVRSVGPVGQELTDHSALNLPSQEQPVR